MLAMSAVQIHGDTDTMLSFRSNTCRLCPLTTSPTAPPHRGRAGGPVTTRDAAPSMISSSRAVPVVDEAHPSVRLQAVVGQGPERGEAFGWDVRQPEAEEHHVVAAVRSPAEQV